MTTQTARIVVALVVTLAGLLASPVAGAEGSGQRSSSSSSSSSYGWPVKPFHRQHPVRGFFGDPRIAEDRKGTTRSFHFGIDISCPDGTPVYATLSGRVVLDRRHHETVSIVGPDGDLTFSYWHVIPSVRDGQVAVAFRTVVGHVAKGWAHVHFSESRDSTYLNPLRAGALGPYADTTRPQLKSLRVERGGRTLSTTPSAGTFDLVVEAYDTTPLPIAAPWHNKPVTPAVLQWRPKGSRVWRTAVDVSWTIPGNNVYGTVFATWTHQNSPWGRRGRYRFFLTHDIDATVFRTGGFAIEVQAADTLGNTTTRRFTLPGAEARTAAAAGGARRT